MSRFERMKRLGHTHSHHGAGHEGGFHLHKNHHGEVGKEVVEHKGEGVESHGVVNGNGAVGMGTEAEREKEKVGEASTST